LSPQAGAVLGGGEYVANEHPRRNGRGQAACRRWVQPIAGAAQVIPQAPH